MKINVNFKTNTNSYSDEELLNIVNEFQWEHGLENFISIREIPDEILLMALEQLIEYNLSNYWDVDYLKINEED